MPHPLYASQPPGAMPPGTVAHPGFAPQPYGFDYRGYPFYPPPPPPTAQYGSYYLAPALSYQPTTAAATAGPAPAPPTPVSTGGSQIALPSVPHPPAYFYGGYTYPYTPGRIVAPILALGKFVSNNCLKSYVYLKRSKNI